MLRKNSRDCSSKRTGAAAVELAFTALFLVPLILGIWEAGRLIEVQQIVSNSAREGARLAAQGYTINSTGAPTQIMASTGTLNVKDYVYQYLAAAGFANLQPGDVTVVFNFTAPGAIGKMTPTDPYLGEKNQPFTVTVSIPWEKVRWIDMGLIRPTAVTFTVSWQMLTDDAFTLNQTMPSM